MSRFVLDCSIAMAWCFADEADAVADSVLDRLSEDVALVPSVWPLEVWTLTTGNTYHESHEHNQDRHLPKLGPSNSHKFTSRQIHLGDFHAVAGHALDSACIPHGSSLMAHLPRRFQ